MAKRKTWGLPQWVINEAQRVVKVKDGDTFPDLYVNGILLSRIVKAHLEIKGWYAATVDGTKTLYIKA